MKDYSNETKSKRRKTILKVILKRYSFVVWLPVLLLIFYSIGVVASNFLAGLTYTEYLSWISNLKLYEKIAVYPSIIIIGAGSTVVSIFSACVVLFCIIFMVEYLRRGTIIKDFLKIIKKVFIVIIYFSINLPKKVINILKKTFLRIKDEKRRLKNAIQEEIEKNND